MDKLKAIDLETVRNLTDIRCIDCYSYDIQLWLLQVAMGTGLSVDVIVLLQLPIIRNISTINISD